MTKYSAYEVAKKVFYEHYEKKSTTLGNRGRVENLYDSGTMFDARTGHNLDYRASIDLMFLAALDNEARKAGDLVLANKVQDIVEWSVGRIYYKVIGGDPTGEIVGDLCEKTTYPTSLPLIYFIKAGAYIKFFMNGSKKGTVMMNRVDQIRAKCKARMVEIYKTFEWTCNGVKDTLSNTVRLGKTYAPTNKAQGAVNGATVLNPLAVLAGGLALDSYFVHHLLEGNASPTSYPHRDMISEIGNWLIKSSYGDTVRQACNYGGSPSSTDKNRSEYNISGYAAWVAGHLPLIGHGTVYPTNFWERPASSFLPQVPKMFKGFQDIFDVFGFLPDTVRQFGADKFTFKQEGHEVYPNDTTAYLYTLAYYGDQTMIDYIDAKTKANANNPSRLWATNDVDIKAGDTVIEACIRRDLTKTAYKKTGQAFTTRGVEGLAAAMFKRLSFND